MVPDKDALIVSGVPEDGSTTVSAVSGFPKTRSVTNEKAVVKAVGDAGLSFWTGDAGAVPIQ